MEEQWLNLGSVVGFRFPLRRFRYTQREAILYALGVGAGQGSGDLCYVYEGCTEGFQVLPTFATLFNLFPLTEVPGLRVHPAMALHGEERLELLRPLPTAGEITGSAVISRVEDKGSGALLVIDASSRDETGDEVARHQTRAFLRGLGGFGGTPAPVHRRGSPPEVPPGAVHKERIPPSQALLYRLSGDMNPTHVDPELAARGGFERPILHGLCAYGYAARAVLAWLGRQNSGRFRSMEARFSGHVYPGETLLTEMWQVDLSTVLFRCRVAERGGFVLTNGVIDLNDTDIVG